VSTASTPQNHNPANRTNDADEHAPAAALAALHAPSERRHGKVIWLIGQSNPLPSGLIVRMV
jgi:hypothetical protein